MSWPHNHQFHGRIARSSLPFVYDFVLGHIQLHWPLSTDSSPSSGSGGSYASATFTISSKFGTPQPVAGSQPTFYQLFTTAYFEKWQYSPSVPFHVAHGMMPPPITFCPDRISKPLQPSDVPFVISVRDLYPTL